MRAHQDAGSRRIAVSGRGRTLVAVGLISLLAGTALGVIDLQRVGVLLLVLPTGAWLAVRQARAGLQIAHQISPVRLEVGDRAEVRLVLGNPSAFSTGPLRITETVPGGRPLRFSVAGVRGRQRRTICYPLPVLRRGHYGVGPTTVVASDPFGLVQARTVTVDATRLMIRPRTDPLAMLPLPIAWRDGATAFSHSVGSGGSDDASVRDYRYGDDLRKIHWKSTARSGALMVRQEERPWHGECLILLDTRLAAYPAGPGEENAALEWAVSGTASIAAHLLQRGRKVTVVTGSGDSAERDPGAVQDLLASTTTAIRKDVRPLVTAIAALGRDATVFAVLAAADGSVLTELAQTPRMPGSATALLLHTGSWAEAAARAGTAARAGAGSAAESDWQSSAAPLRAAGWRVVPVQAGDEIAELWPTMLGSRQLATRQDAL